MLTIQGFTFNAYQENTWVISDESGECILIDPGCHSATEQRQLEQYVSKHQLTPVLLLNTHGHIDHMLGNAWAVNTFQIPFHTHQLVVNELQMAPSWGAIMGLNVAPSPLPDHFLSDGDTVTFGAQRLEVLFTPGHSAGHISFFHRGEGHLFSGDVLFQQSIGRTDLPGGDYLTLMNTIANRLFPLGDKVVVYPGHGPTTTIGAERATNPFLREYFDRLRP